MARWPVSCDETLNHGTMYVSEGRLLNEMVRWHYAGQGFRFRKHWTCYQPTRDLTYRNANLLKPENETDFWHIMGSFAAAGMKPPSSFADAFRNLYRSPRPILSITAPFRTLVYGAWEEAFIKTPGTYYGKVYWYDLNSAYRWAACCGLPDPESAYPIERLTDSRIAIYLVEGPKYALPYWYRDGIHTLTSEELPLIANHRSIRVIRGVGYDKLIDLSSIFADIDVKFPYCHKRIARAFWGQWNSRRGPTRVTWKSGLKENTLPNPLHHPIWAAFITSRIKLRFLPYRQSILHVFVDAMLTTHPVETGVEPGAWRELGTFGSIWIRWPGYWGSQWETIRHSGEKLPIPKGRAILESRPWREALA